MFFTDEMIHTYEYEHTKQYIGQGGIPPVPLHIIVETIANVLETAIDLYPIYPDDMLYIIKTIKENCLASIRGGIKDLTLELKVWELQRLKDTDQALNCFLRAHYKIRQIASGMLLDLGLRSVGFWPNPKQKREAQHILLDFLGLTLEKLEQLHDQKSLSENEASTTRLSNESKNSEESDELGTDQHGSFYVSNKKQKIDNVESVRSFV
ncbi:MAG: hypothetical protein LRY67_03950 [Gammaproteobacteria bacterium]|nr:hypothetical protein [Gammaproteobacteria bacterium]MCD8524900.1 hypothetical protein [Gammaproteobacteria bacterium]MCD8541961.1 hypothetical protein [Gammaproteobacteria bacterium]MCD8573877.1 hypothetical protein [Gammaproteobacteria bacterium]